MADESEKLTRASQGSVDVLAKALGLLADPGPEIAAPVPRPVPPRETQESATDLRLAAIEIRLGELEKSVSAVDRQMARFQDGVVRIETAIGQLRDHADAQYRSGSRVFVIAALSLGVLILIVRWI